MRQYAGDMICLIKKEFQNRKFFFQSAKKESTSLNLRILLAANLAAILILLGFIMLTPYIIKDWQPTPYHIGFIPALLFCFVLSLIYYIRGSWKYRAVTALCVLFSIVLLTFSILLDTVGTPGGPGTFLPMMLIAIPALFTLPFRISYALILLAEFLYIATVFIYKNNVLGQYDIFRSVVALMFSIVIANIIMSLKVRDYSIQTKYKQQSMTDGLTNILNKEASFEAFRKYLQTYNPHVTCTLIIMDLDNFKTLNDTRGHAAGDNVLQKVGVLLLETFRHIDIVGRFGGDEFVVLMKGSDSFDIVKEKISAMQQHLRQIGQEEADLQMSASFGVVLVTDQEVESHSLFLQAVAALYDAKRKGRATYVMKTYQT